MASVFSIPPYPGAVLYNIQYSDPTSGNPNKQNPFGPWTAISQSPILAGNESNIVDSSGDQNLRVYRIQPVVSINNSNVPLQWYDPMDVSTEDTYGLFIYRSKQYDPLLSLMLMQFRDFIGDVGVDQVSATSEDYDTGAGVGLLQFDGSRTRFYLADIPDATNAILLQGSVHVIVNGVELQRNVDYVVYYEAGAVEFKTAPTEGTDCQIYFREAEYSNRVLLGAIDNAIGSLSHFGISGYNVTSDNNVRRLNAGIPNDGLPEIIFALAEVIMNRAQIRIKSENARAYKQNDFSMDTAPGRIVDAMAKVATDDLNELRFKTNNYIRVATSPLIHSLADGFFDTSNFLPLWPFLMGPGFGWYVT